MMVLNKNKDVPFVRRLLDPSKSPPPLMEDGFTVTHKLAQTDNLVYPTVVAEGDSLVDLVAAGRDPFTEALQRGDFIAFSSPEEALEFSQTYKQGLK